MYIQRLTIKNYRNFGDSPFTIQLRPFTLLLGENNIGKTNLLNAIALLFSQEIAVFQRRTLQLDDLNYTTVTAFKKQVSDSAVDVKSLPFPEVVVEASLTDFDNDQEAVVGDWFTDATLKTVLVTYRFALRASFEKIKWIEEQRKLLLQMGSNDHLQQQLFQEEAWKQVEFPIGDYRYTIYGGGAASNECDAHHLRMLRAEVLDALRDARRELIAGGDQRLLYRVLRQGVDTKYADLKQRLTELEKCVQENQSLKGLKEDVQKLLHRVSLQSSPRENAIDFQFSSPDAAELLKKISMIYGVDPINVARNGLGRNNLLYLSLVLSQLARINIPDEDAYACFRFIGIEEPEAHLHPHLQDHLARNIESIRQEYDKTTQLVLTSHSTHIASKLKLNNTAVLFQAEPTGPLANHYILDGLDEKKDADSIRFLSLYLDATKSRMFFARRLILVEGIAEQVLIPRLFEIYHHGSRTLESVGATVVNVNGVAFRHFLTIIRNGYFRRCVVLTDCDSATHTKDRAHALKIEFDTQDLIQVCITKDTTFEKDLIASNCTGKGKELLFNALKDTKPLVGKAMAEKTGTKPLDVANFFDSIEDSKSEFAFNLARRLETLDCGVQIPLYITSAFQFLA